MNMGTSTDAIICYGIALDEEAELPWAIAPDSDIEDWWRREIHGYVPTLEPFTPEGNYVDGVEPDAAEVNAYFAEQAAFDKQHPLPITLVMHCSGDSPMWIIAAQGTCLSASRGYPLVFDPHKLVCDPADASALREFCAQHLGIEAEPQWLLCSLWF